MSSTAKSISWDSPFKLKLLKTTISGADPESSLTWLPSNVGGHTYVLAEERVSEHKFHALDHSGFLFKLQLAEEGDKGAVLGSGLA